jgi:hypothetical protein
MFGRNNAVGVQFIYFMNCVLVVKCKHSLPSALVLCNGDWHLETKI